MDMENNYILCIRRGTLLCVLFLEVKSEDGHRIEIVHKKKLLRVTLEMNYTKKGRQLRT